MLLFDPKNDVIKKKRSSAKLQRIFWQKSSCLHATSMGLSLLNVIWIHCPCPGVIVPPAPPLVGPALSQGTPKKPESYSVKVLLDNAE